MAPVATLLGGVFGTIAAVVAMIFFGTSFAMATAIYFGAALSVACLLVAGALLTPRDAAAFPMLHDQDAGLTRQT